MKIHIYNVNKLTDCYQKDNNFSSISEWLARKIISETFHIKPHEIKFDNNEYGKPYAVNLDIYFNISHSKNYIICAIDKNPIGVDIEKIRPLKDSVLKVFCTDKELDYINSSDNKKKEAIKLWTLKEAYFKAIGTGIRELKDVEFNIGKEEIASNKENVAFQTVEIDSEYIISICQLLKK